MKKSRLLIFTLLSIFIISFNGCSDDDPEGRVNFVNEVIELTTDDLSPFDVQLSINPAAPRDSEINITITGAEAGEVFTTTPEISGGMLTIPVTSGATSASFTITPIEEGIGFNDVVLTLDLTSVGAGLGRGLTTQAQVNIINKLDTGFELPVLEEFAMCGPEGDGNLPPEGWKEEIVQQNAEGSTFWRCIPEFFGVVGIEVNPFVAGSEDQTHSEVWMISPRINLLDASAPKLSFDVDRRFDPTEDFTDDHYDIVISTDYNGFNFNDATWVRFQAGYDAMTANDPGGDNMENTGDLDLSEYAGEVISIGFIYRAGAPGSFDATILRIGNVSVTE